MQNFTYQHSLLLILAVIITSCNHKVATTKTEATKAATTQNVTSQSGTTQVSPTATIQSKTTAGPPVIIYKTKKDYNTQVPVMLSDDKTTVVSYPDIKDIYYNNELSLPTKLADGYLLDNRGIGPNVAFLTLTYAQYSKLPATPKASELFKSILDPDPLAEMFFCGTRYQYSDIVNELNKKIAEGKLSEFKKLK